jgi:hypothetical protein
MGSCGPPTQHPAPCTEWRIAGSDTVVSESYGPDDAGMNRVGFSLSGLVPSGNGALIAWTTFVYAGSGGPPFWGTRALNMDGTPRTAIVSLKPFPVQSESPDNFMGLAVTPQCAFGALAYSDSLADGNGDPGCSFVPLDGDGNEIGSAVSLPLWGNDGGVNGSRGGYCIDLGPAPDGFSYIQEAPQNGGTGNLVPLGTNGSLHPQKSLGTFSGFNPGRLVLDDESFLLITFYGTNTANVYTWEVAHYDARGVQIAQGKNVATSRAFLMAETSRGVLAAYIGSDPASPLGGPLYVVPLSRDGVPTATPVALPVTGTVGPLWTFSLAPSPSGDVILNWINVEGPPPGTGYRFFAMELDPGGGQRGPVLDLGTLEGSAGGSVLVSADGERALLVYAISSNGGVPANSTSGVHTLPLACSAH